MLSEFIVLGSPPVYHRVGDGESMAQLFISFSSSEVETARAYQRALEGKGVTSIFFSGDSKTGIKSGEYWETMLYTELRRCRVFVPLLSPAWLASSWCNSELRIARMMGADIVPVRIAPIADNADPILAMIQQACGEIDDETLDKFAETIARKLQRRGAAVPQGDLFPGILPFDLDRAALFSGRDHEIDDLYNQVVRASRSPDPTDRVIIYTGASGVGKSSLMRAGLLGSPSFQADFRALGPIRGNQGINGAGESLARALASLRGIAPEQTRAALKGPVTELIESLGDVLHTEKRRALVIAVDQGEELVLDRPDPFIDILRAIIAEPTLPVCLLVTVRDDAAVRVQAALGGVIAPLAPMTLENLGAALRGPLEAAGLLDEAAIKLIERILRDAEGAADMLPLAAFAMAKLEKAGKLSVEHYAGLEGIIEDEAQSIWTNHVVPAGLEAPMQAFFVPGLVTIDEAGGVRLGAMASAAVPTSIAPVVEKFIETRLLHRAGTEQPFVEPAHEALLRQWTQLEQWLIDERERIAVLELAVRDAAAWKGGGRSRATYSIAVSGSKRY